MSKKQPGWFFVVTSLKNRFVTGDIPTQDTFQNLCDSVPFILDTNAKASTSYQGLVKTVSDANAKSNSNPDSTYTYSVQPSQLPSVGGGTGTEDSIVNDISNFSGAAISVADDGTPTRNNYVVTLTSAFKTWLGTTLTSIDGLIDGITSSISTINTSISTINVQISDVQDDISDIQDEVATIVTNIPPGGVIMYDGSMSNFDGTGLGINDLDGWALCNGQNGTRDMGGRVVFGKDGIDFVDIGDTGGSATFTLAEANLPPHAHTGTTDSGGSHSHTGDSAVTSILGGSALTTADQTGSGSNVTLFMNAVGISSNGAHTHTFTTDDGTGTSDPVTHLQPYIVMAYIKKL